MHPAPPPADYWAGFALVQGFLCGCNGTLILVLFLAVWVSVSQLVSRAANRTK